MPQYELKKKEKYFFVIKRQSCIEHFFHAKVYHAKMCHAKVRHAKVFYPKVPLTPKCPSRQSVLLCSYVKVVICQSITHAKVVPRQSVQITLICQSGFTPKLLLRQTIHVKVFHDKVFHAKMSVSPFLYHPKIYAYFKCLVNRVQYDFYYLQAFNL